MINEIQSKALEVNLRNTKVDYEIPAEHQWFMSLSENQWGLHKRVMEFFAEYDHPMSNRAEVVKALPNVTINDFWLYKELPPLQGLRQNFNASCPQPGFHQNFKVIPETF